jgi:alkanesulfonate monooxygenase SsuD/methylene tetrahydromethanopterin reductase-like flavin-dependent oxidoreductase (luciferase family)
MRQGMRRILGSPPFQAYFVEAGFGEEIGRVRTALANGDEPGFMAAVSDRMLDETTLIGTPTQIRDKVEAWHAAGVNRLTIAVPSPDDIRTVADIFE